ncbi:MAG: Abortive infection protein AbiEi [Clostridiaceae bacterium]|nr:Abortive infection protein AbiEi [Clostridiaceae bacterium]
MNEIEEKVYKVFKANSGYARTRDITNAGIYNIYLNKFLEDGRIERIKRGLYRWVGMNETNYQGIVDVSKAIPGGVICLLSALSFYNLTTAKPMEVSIAVNRKRKVVKPDYPPTKIYYFADSIFKAGIEEQRIGNISVLMYDREKSICDCIKYRNQLGMDITKEALYEYLKNTNRNLELLMKYAEICRIKPVLKNYLEVLL